MATPALADAVQIAAGTSEDLPAVMQIMESAFGQTFGEAWTRSQLAGILPMAGVMLVLASDRQTSTVVGFSLSRTVAGEAELLLIGVRRDYQRGGIGRRLLGHFFEEARRDGVRRVHLEVRDGNDAIQMYRDAGFAPVGRRRNYYRSADGNRFDALTLAREL